MARAPTRVSIEDVIREPRVASKGFHVLAGQAWRTYGESKHLQSPLVYASIELRCAIERVVLELYTVMAEVKPDLAKIETIKSFKGLLTLLYEDAGNAKVLHRALTFNQIYVNEVIGAPHRLAIPNPGTLQKYWSRLSHYCHYQAEDANTWGSPQWLRKGYVLLREVEDHLWDLVIMRDLGWVDARTLPQEMADERARFVKGDEPADTLQRRLRLIKPVLEERFKLRK